MSNTSGRRGLVRSRATAFAVFAVLVIGAVVSPHTSVAYGVDPVSGVLLRIATVTETAGQPRVGASIRLPLVVDAAEQITADALFVVREGESDPLPTQVGGQRVEAGRMVAADVYVVDDVDAFEKVTYELRLAATSVPTVIAPIDVVDVPSGVTIETADLEVTIPRTGSQAGTISTLSAPALGVSGTDLLARATLREERMMNGDINADAEVEDNGSAAGWQGAAASGPEVLSWSSDRFASGAHSLAIDTTPAEAVQLDLNPNALIIDFTSRGYVETGTWRNSALAGYQQPSHRYSTTAGSTATFSFTVATGDYDVYVWIPGSVSSAQNNPAAAPYTVQAVGGPQAVTHNQREGIGTFAPLGSWALDGATTLALAAGGTSTTRADAILVLPAGQPLMPRSFAADTGSAGYVETGTWATSNYPGNTASAHRYSITPGSRATWSFTGMEPRDYDVYVWVPAAGTSNGSNSSTASYEIAHSAGTSTVVLNQKLSTNSFQLLGTFTMGAAGSVALTLDDTARHRADAVVLVPHGVPVPDPLPLSASPGGSWTSEAEAVAPGERLAVHAWGARENADPGAIVSTSARFLDGSGTEIGLVQIGAFVDASWTRVTGALTVPAAAASVQIVHGVEGRAKAWFDNVTLYKAAASAAALSAASSRQNVSVAVETGVAVVIVTVVNQLVVSGTPRQAYQLVQYRIPRNGSSISQTVEYRGTSDVSDAPESVAATSLVVLDGQWTLPGGGALSTTDFSIALGDSDSGLDTATAVVSTVGSSAVIVVGSNVDTVTSVGVNGARATFSGPTRKSTGVATFAERYLRQDRTWSTLAILGNDDPESLRERYLVEANPLVASVDDPGVTFEDDLVPLIRELNDTILTTTNSSLAERAWTARALAAYVNADITADPAYTAIGDAIIDANIRPEYLTVAYHASRFQNDAALIDEDLQQLPFLYYFSGDERLPQYAEAIGLAALQELAFDDNNGDRALAGSKTEFAALEDRSSVKNMAATAGMVFVWGMNQRGNVAGLEELREIFEAPQFAQWVGAGETAYIAVSNGDQVAVRGDAEPYYSSVVAGVIPFIEEASGGAIDMSDSGAHSIWASISIDTNGLGEDASGWPQSDYVQTHSHRLAWNPSALWRMIPDLAETDGVTFVTTTARILGRYVQLTREPVSADTAELQLPNLSDPDFGRQFNRNWYSSDGLTRETNPGVTQSVAKVVNMIYFHHFYPGELG
ncbi:hypothetical protein QMG83_01485 [Salinibacterium sp. G-O1]|uniref:golvesin C-terminal-like domain-containing protein n=1 Tax=Salinibacterium sp. G-O1 TaxID=3046208 RepID=UPI0024BA7A07|nr:hypothetical protein [Salinibacterium sp. G-O1]MDJ0333890.1 hypothetical protein [Salinibacterium sp. G-O1]